MEHYLHWGRNDAFLVKTPESVSAYLLCVAITFCLAVLGPWLEAFKKQNPWTITPKGSFIISAMKIEYFYFTKSLFSTLQHVLHLTVMLIVMTLNLGYISSAILGHFLGSFAFDRNPENEIKEYNSASVDALETGKREI